MYARGFSAADGSFPMPIASGSESLLSLDVVLHLTENQVFDVGGDVGGIHFP